ncbi:MAG: CoB--CoM heterodisulfide reductase iron-sulfur subunit B family protein [Candidatus Heimdallarchaeota archaeon]
MKFAYYPGCVPHSLCRELLSSTASVASQIGLTLVEIPQAACCGAGYLNEKAPNLGNVINARTLALAERLNLDLVTGCSTCYGNLNVENNRLRNDTSLRNKANSVLQEFKLEFQNGPTVRHIAEVFASSQIAECIREKSTVKLDGLRIVIFTGCHFIRPFPVNCDLDSFFTKLGAKVSSCDTWEKCCGFHTIFTHRKMSLGMVGDIIEAGANSGGNAIVTLCPLCYIALDMFQGEARREGLCRHSLPVMHLPQAIGMAMGMSSRQLGLHKHINSMHSILNGLKT